VEDPKSITLMALEEGTTRVAEERLCVYVHVCVCVCVCVCEDSVRPVGEADGCTSYNGIHAAKTHIKHVPQI